ncbi:MAG TPA: hypothetical protein PL017_01460 [Tenuifilaceae bacterium]|nr:hypothetical protein [Tenuifilaceae bacterium]HPE17218.1 hypothetical protein [Tenuifilaceae bacterium]HPJ44734.1 hypothetical protein [Tenuifilaceae bacterium]HPQ33330.1 hypothetical protein [Tenuifilaceae bacterium]HRX68657.1 hypothetical protein [Tenuifilaceae bacterium]
MLRKLINRTLFSFFLILLWSFSSTASKEGDGFDSFSDRLFFGGTIGVTFGDVNQLDIVPIGGMWILPQWSVGVGGRYTYFSRRSIYQNDRVLRTHIWGFSGFTQVLPIRNFSEVTPIPLNGGIFLHGEYEGLYLDQRMINTSSALSGKTWVHLYLAGVGYRQILGERAALNILLLWDLSNNPLSPYLSNPILRVNVTF